MTAPALILLAPGSHDQRVTQVAHTLRKQMQMMRPALSVQVAFLDDCPPTGPQVVSALAGRGTQEVVFVPLDVCRAIQPSAATTEMVTRVRTAHPQLKVKVSRPIGPAAELLAVLDERLRAALRTTRTTELDGLVLSLPSAGDVRGNALISRRARQWSTHHRLPVVVGFADGSGPSVAHAVATLRSQGRRHIAVGSLFISDSEAYAHQAELALAQGVVAVSAPLGAHDRLLELAMARYAYAAMDLLDDAHDDAADADDDLEADSHSSTVHVAFGG